MAGAFQADAFQVDAFQAAQSAPTITSISPNETAENTSKSGVVITGTGYLQASAVTVGGHNATSFTIDSDTQITAVFPAHAAATDETVVVTGPGGNSGTSAADNFTYYEGTTFIPRVILI